jgi:hypothetical protein
MTTRYIDKQMALNDYGIASRGRGNRRRRAYSAAEDCNPSPTAVILLTAHDAEIAEMLTSDKEKSNLRVH